MIHDTKLRQLESGWRAVCKTCSWKGEMASYADALRHAEEHSGDVPRCWICRTTKPTLHRHLGSWECLNRQRCESNMKTEGAKRPRQSGLLPPGECVQCDRIQAQNDNGAPRHAIRDRCESGKRPHCTCPLCFG